MAIIITRPRANATLTAQFLQNACIDNCLHEFYILPLSKTLPLKIAQQDIVADSVLISSSATFKYLPEFILSQIQNLPLYIIGKKTAQAAQQSGMKNIMAIYENGQDFIDKAKIAAETSLLYLVGKRHFEDFLQNLQSKFINLNLIEIYDSKAIHLTRTDLAKLPTASPQHNHIIMLYSALAAKNIKQLQSVIGQNTVLLCLSSRIAQAIPKNINAKIIIAAKPNEQSMLASLQLLKK